MCMCICPEKAVKSKGYKWCNPGSSNGKTGQCSEVTPCPPGSSFVHTHPYEFPGGSGFSKGDRWFCNKRQFPLYVCSKDGTVRRIDPQPGKPGPAPPEGISHKRCCPGKVIGNF